MLNPQCPVMEESRCFGHKFVPLSLLVNAFHGILDEKKVYSIGFSPRFSRGLFSSLTHEDLYLQVDPCIKVPSSIWEASEFIIEAESPTALFYVQGDLVPSVFSAVSSSPSSLPLSSRPSRHLTSGSSFLSPLLFLFLGV